MLHCRANHLDKARFVAKLFIDDDAAQAGRRY